MTAMRSKTAHTSVMSADRSAMSVTAMSVTAGTVCPVMTEMIAKDIQRTGVRRSAMRAECAECGVHTGTGVLVGALMHPVCPRMGRLMHSMNLLVHRMGLRMGMLCCRLRMGLCPALHPGMHRGGPFLNALTHLGDRRLLLFDVHRGDLGFDPVHDRIGLRRRNATQLGDQAVDRMVGTILCGMLRPVRMRLPAGIGSALILCLSVGSGMLLRASRMTLRGVRIRLGLVRIAGCMGVMSLRTVVAGSCLSRIGVGRRIRRCVSPIGSTVTECRPHAVLGRLCGGIYPLLCRLGGCLHAAVGRFMGMFHPLLSRGLSALRPLHRRRLGVRHSHMRGVMGTLCSRSGRRAFCGTLSL